MRIDFFKGEVGGNDFIIVEERSLNYGEIASEVCRRHYSIGSDGLIVYLSENNSFKMEFYNPDGKKVDFCGNGALLISLFAEKYKGMGKDFVFSTDIGKIRAKVKGNSVSIRFPRIPQVEEKLNINGMDGILINAGVPHLIISIKDLEEIDVNKIGSALAHNPKFPEYGVNVDFYKISDGEIRMRTYERGVEAETLSCGSGIMAVGSFAIRENLVDNPCVVYTRGGKYSVEKDKDNLYLEGNPHIIFKGTMEEKRRLRKNEKWQWARGDGR